MRIVVAAAIAFVAVMPSAIALQEHRSSPEDKAVGRFEQSVESYVRLRDRLAAPLPPMSAKTGSLSMVLAKRYLASAIRSARSSRPGSVFDPEVSSYFRELIAETMESPDFAAFVSELQARRQPFRGIHPLPNEPFPADVAEEVPAVLARLLPALPEAIRYRVAAYDLVLLDLHAEVVIDVLPDVFALPASEDE